VCDLLSALNTGHDGGAGTLHANSPAEVPARMEALASLGGLSREALRSQLGAAVQVIVHMRRRPDGARQLTQIAVLERTPDGLTILPAWHLGHWQPAQAALADALRTRGVTPPW
jgi:pilus assembly protein CpaF